jgi:2-polyprenyl-3-methyl-5-hydroxy-6-metoxy-1,4-benzoquinol methylase
LYVKNSEHASSKSDEPWVAPWPADGLESVAHCPVCGDVSREILHPDLVDNAFRVAPGKWTLWRCAKCSSGYLDPRPTPATIHWAYANYYTHRESVIKNDYASLSPLRKLRRRLVNGYTNWRFGTQAFPSSPFGVLVVHAIPSVKKELDRHYRQLPKPPKSGGRLLDVGCGDGSFLSLARTCGWSVVGLDPDPKAATNAAKHGLTVHEGGIEYFDGQSALFDVITLNHVIEHVYDPVKVLESCLALLKPGGQLWLETPNIDSFGHARFQENWRGLETPRHLVLFNRRSLSQAFASAGFPVPRDRVRPSACAGVFQASFAMARGRSPYAPVAMPIALKLHAALAAFAEMLLPSRREFLTVAAIKDLR